MKRTPWFSADVKPVHVGVYEVIRVHSDYPAGTRLYWDGGGWLHTEHSSAGRGEGWGAWMSVLKGDKWRGLAEPPK